MKINLIGTIFGGTGYASHTRQLFNALVEAGAEVKLETGLIQAWEGMVTDAELKAIKQEHFDDGVTIMISTPPYWPSAMNEPCKRFYGFCVWEGDRVPDSWLKHLIAADGILVPSAHVQRAIMNTVDCWKDDGETYGALLEKISIVHHGVNTLLFQPQERPKDSKFCFVANKGWAQGMNDRGGLQFVFKAFAEEFSAAEPVELRVKINTAYCPPGWNLQEEIKKLGLPEGRAPFWIMADEVAYKALPKCYEGDVFVSPSMSEAFSIPCAEAMAMGLPVITTGYGGQTDYVNEDNGWLVDYDLFEVEHDVNYEGIQWARPKIDHLRALMRQAYEHKELVKEKGKQARADAEKLTWRDSAEKLLEAIGGNS